MLKRRAPFRSRSGLSSVRSSASTTAETLFGSVPSPSEAIITYPIQAQKGIIPGEAETTIISGCLKLHQESVQVLVGTRINEPSLLKGLAQALLHLVDLSFSRVSRQKISFVEDHNLQIINNAARQMIQRGTAGRSKVKA